MKKLILLILLVFCLIPFSNAQNEFGTVGTYWQYNFEPHNGDGTGWTKITITKDTLINGENFKKLEWVHFRDPIMEPSYVNTNIFLMQIVNDSVFINDDLVLDFSMELTDTLDLDLQSTVNIQLAVDSITTEQIDGFDYKKWHGQKICVDGPGTTGPYESFTILESVGQIDMDYLLWNLDNCIIGGGVNRFSCYKNGDFTYPPNTTCVPLLVETNKLFIENEIKLFPNPVSNLLQIKINNSITIDNVIILNFEGKELFREKGNSGNFSIDTNFLISGMYLLKIETSGKIITKRFTKI